MKINSYSNIDNINSDIELEIGNALSYLNLMDNILVLMESKLKQLKTNQTKHTFIDEIDKNREAILSIKNMFLSINRELLKESLH